jgi:hypothetical protein
LADFLFMAQFGLFSINILVGHLEHLTDQCWRLLWNFLRSLS